MESKLSIPLSDLLFTGTPEGVGPLKAGDLVEVMGGNIEYTFKCGPKSGE